MKRTPFTHFHEQLGAKMASFAGYTMPIEYSGVNDEHLTVRNGVGVFDVSHMGEFWIKGDKALELIQKVSTNDASTLTIGQVQYSCLPNGKGGIVDDLLVHKYEDQKYLLVVNASNMEKDWAWINQQNTMGAILENASEKTAELAVQGPKAIQVLQKLTSVNLSEINYYNFVVGEMAGIKEVIISATGYTGAGGFELYCYNSDAEQLWNAIFEAGKEEGIKPIGLAARDTLRLEKGYTLYGNDIDDTTSPIEASLSWIVKGDKDFIDKDLIISQLQNGVSRKLVGFQMIDKGIPRHDYLVLDAKGNTIGKVTSGTMSPVLKVGIGMAYVQPEFAAIDSEIFIQIRNKSLKAKVVKRPFVK